MEGYWVFGYIPLISFVGGMVLIFHMISKGRHTEQSHKILLGFLAFSSLYALSDALFFNASSAGQALFIARFDLSFVFLALLFIVMFPISLRRELKGADWLTTLLTSFLLLPIWLWLVVDVRLGPWGWQGVYHTPSLALFLVVCNSLMFYTAFQLWGVYAELRRARSSFAHNVFMIFLGFLLLAVLGNVLNVLFEIVFDLAPPVLSTTMIVPITMIALSFNRGRGREHR